MTTIVQHTWGAELTLIEREFTLVGVNPGLDAFKEQASVMHSAALDAARQAGKALGV